MFINFVLSVCVGCETNFKTFKLNYVKKMNEINLLTASQHSRSSKYTAHLSHFNKS